MKKVSIKVSSYENRTSLGAQLIKNPSEMQKTWVPFLGWEDHLEKEIATHSGSG